MALNLLNRRMLMTMISDTEPRWPSLARGGALALLLAVPLAGCDLGKLLESEAPSRLDADALQSPTQARLLVNGAIADFECAHGAFVVAGGLIGDELEDSQLAAANWSYDRRDFNAAPSGVYGTNSCQGQIFGVYTPLSTARWSADNILSKLQGWSDQEVSGRQQLIATAAVYSGFSHLELGMIMCSAAVDQGPEMQPADFFRAAEQRFGVAIEAANQANAPALRNAAIAGRARARLYLGNKAGAATDAQAVPPGFVFNATAAEDDARRWNRVFHFVNFSRFAMIEEQSQSLRTGGAPDPRTRANFTNERAVDGRPAVMQTKYASRGAPMPITRYEEAQLILAEAEGGARATSVINALRARHNLPPMTAAEAGNLQQTLIEERRRELFLEGQRLYDIKRFNLPLVPAVGAEFLKGGTYGNTRCLPLPDVERFNNPNIT